MPPINKEGNKTRPHRLPYFHPKNSLYSYCLGLVPLSLIYCPSWLSIPSIPLFVDTFSSSPSPRAFFIHFIETLAVMHLSQYVLCWLAAGSVELTSAHTSFTNFFVDKVSQGDGVAVRMSNIPSQATNPIKGIDSPQVACGRSPVHQKLTKAISDML